MNHMNFTGRVTPELLTILPHMPAVTVITGNSSLRL